MYIGGAFEYYLDLSPKRVGFATERHRIFVLNKYRSEMSLKKQFEKNPKVVLTIHIYIHSHSVCTPAYTDNIFCATFQISFVFSGVFSCVGTTIAVTSFSLSLSFSLIQYVKLSDTYMVYIYIYYRMTTDDRAFTTPFVYRI